MTIGKKLYAGFGLILAILGILFLVNLVTGYMEKAARTNAGMALESVRTVESVRYQIMLNRLNMNNFLLSGEWCAASFPKQTLIGGPEAYSEARNSNSTICVVSSGAGANFHSLTASWHT